MDTRIIGLFNTALAKDAGNETPVDFTELSETAMQKGYIVHPDCATVSVRDFLDTITLNVNATFYKTWTDVTSRSRFELLIDQLIHYATTYGTNGAFGNGYVPNDGDIPEIPFETYKVILPATEEEILSRCMDMLASGIALSKETMETMSDYVICYVQAHDAYRFDISTIRNREAVTYISDRLGILPGDRMELLRHIIYKTTGNTMIVKNDELCQAIKSSPDPFDFGQLDSHQLESLASIFLRFRKPLLAFRHTTPANREVINRLRRMAVRLHEPMREGFWQSVFSEAHTREELAANLPALTPFKKVSIMQSCIERARSAMNSGDDMSKDRFYLVRNQKGFVRRDYRPDTDPLYAEEVYEVLYDSLMDDLRRNSMKTMTIDGQETAVPKKVRFAEGVDVPFPSSEKSFIGNYPYGTSYRLTEHNFIGIYWRNEWDKGHDTNDEDVDYDLSLINIDGNGKLMKYGWNSDYYNDGKSIVFSGDMTAADPEATEVLLIKKPVSGMKSLIDVRLFWGGTDSKFRLFLGQDNIPDEDFHEGYMVNPNSIRIETDVKVTGKRSTSVGVINNDRIVLVNTHMDTGRVSVPSIFTQSLMDSIIEKSNCFVQTRDMLEKAGFEIVGDDYEGEVDIDFRALDKDSLISIMRGNE